MAYRWRDDEPGAWHHVMNRGLARRTVFEDREAIRYFLSALARIIRRGQLELHAYCLMTTHFHLLVRSPTGELSEAMALSQNQFVRWFNRRARRDGPLFRGRFISRRVQSLSYRRQVVRYIDQNPVQARMVAAPEEYPHCSARNYTSQNGPRWLERSWVEADALKQTQESHFDREIYKRAFGHGLDTSAYELIDKRIHCNQRCLDPLDDLLGMAPEGVACWMRRKAKLADGTKPGLPTVSSKSVLDWSRQEADSNPDWKLRRGKKETLVWPIIEAGLLRDLAATSWPEMRLHLGASEGVVRRRYETHRSWIESHEKYRRICGKAGSDLLASW